MRRLLKAEDGSTVVEFALVVPMLLMLLVAVMQLGILLHANSGIRELMGWAGRSAIIAYQSSTPPATSAFATQITTEARSGGYGLEPARLTPAVSIVTNQESGVRSVTITLDYSVILPLPLMPALTIDLDQSRTYYAPIQ